MELYAGQTYWDKTLPAPTAFPRLAGPLRTDVLIVGGGISGTLCAQALSAQGLSVTLMEKNCLGRGSSLAHTGLLMYKSDKMLCQFIEDIGAAKAVRFHQICLAGMDQLTAMAGQLPGAGGYRLRDSIYYASRQADGEKLVREYESLRQYGFPAEFLSGPELKKRYGIDKSCALRTWRDADVNPYQFIRALTQLNLERGVRYYENTAIDLDSAGEEQVFTADGQRIEFQHLVVTTGYSRLFPELRSRVDLLRTYAFCSEPIGQELWPDGAMVWETKNPYLYFRATPDNRVIGGGLDEAGASLEMDPEKIAAKAQAVAQEIEAIFPSLRIPVAYAWEGRFVTSHDGLPFIGRFPHHSNHYYLLGYGGNGTCYAKVGAAIISDLILGRDNPDLGIVQAERS